MDEERDMQFKLFAVALANHLRLGIVAAYADDRTRKYTLTLGVTSWAGSWGPRPISVLTVTVNYSDLVGYSPEDIKAMVAQYRKIDI